ncbi:phenylalanine--tRNA ligase subunit beta [Gammaproteobacteria bacterium]
MRISEVWLREWVNPPVTTQALADQLTLAGLEVEGLEPACAEFSGVVVAAVVSVSPHPNAEKLSLCQVDDGTGTPLTIVCGAANARPGLRAPLARLGALLPGGLLIRPATLRGVESSGMLCSARELGLDSNTEGLLELAPDAPIGIPLRDYLALDDRVIEINLTPNRGDCLSLAGIAREVAAINRLPLTTPVSAHRPTAEKDGFRVRVEAPEACPRYACRIIRDLDATAKTPLWMRERLRRAGLRAIQPLVDVTNYVLLEWGQPLHAFDLDRLEGEIQVRWARDRETLTLLDGKSLTLAPDTLVIADANQPVALAGIMGGDRSGVQVGTTQVLLESAFFSPIAILGRARRHGLQTDSSQRFERGVDPALQVRALKRATELLLDIAGGLPGPVLEILSADHLPRRPAIPLAPKQVEQLLGLAIPAPVCQEILERLGCLITRGDEVAWQVTPPSWRFDLEYPVDLIEEIARLHGYQQIPEVQGPQRVALASAPEACFDLNRAKALLVDRGYQEVITYSFISPEQQRLLSGQEPTLTLVNPLSPELSVMRESLWPGLLGAALHNQSRQQGQLKLFESGLRFHRQGDRIDQDPLLAGLASGHRLPEQWGETSQPLDFYDIRGDVEALLGPMIRRGELRFRASHHHALHPGQSARLEYEGQTIGWLGMLHPDMAQRLTLVGDVFLFELWLRTLRSLALPGFREISRFPSIRRDLAVILDPSVTWDDIKICIRTSVPQFLRDILPFDVYTGKKVESGRRSIAFGLIFQDSSRTLTDNEVDAAVEILVSSLLKQFNAQLRD